jgi:hypothetical protein
MNLTVLNGGSTVVAAARESKCILASGTHFTPMHLPATMSDDFLDRGLVKNIGEEANQQRYFFLVNAYDVIQ